MTNGIRIVAIAILAIAAFVAYSSVFTVDEREKALVIRLGQIQRTIEKPGLYFKMPFVEELVYAEDRLLFFESVDKSIQVVDGRRYNVDAIIMLKVVATTSQALTRRGDRRCSWQLWLWSVRW